MDRGPCKGSLFVSIPRDSFFQEQDKLGKFVPVSSEVSILIQFQGIMYHHLFREGRGFPPRKAPHGNREREQRMWGRMMKTNS